MALREYYGRGEHTVLGYPKTMRNIGADTVSSTLTDFATVANVPYRAENVVVWYGYGPRIRYTVFLPVLAIYDIRPLFGRIYRIYDAISSPVCRILY